MTTTSERRIKMWVSIAAAAILAFDDRPNVEVGSLCISDTFHALHWRPEYDVIFSEEILRRAIADAKDRCDGGWDTGNRGALVRSMRAFIRRAENALEKK